MSDRNALAAAFAAHSAEPGNAQESPRDRPGDALAGICESLNAMSGDAVREGWWRRGGELFEPSLLAARRATHPLPREATQVRHSLIATGRAGVTEWTFAPIDIAAALKPIDRAESEIPVDHPMAEEIAMHLAEVRRGWQHLGALHDQTTSDEELAQRWSAQWPIPDDAELAEAWEILNRPVAVLSERPAPHRSEILGRFAVALAPVAPEWRVEERRNGAAIASASHERKVLYVDPTRVDGEQSLERLIVHEVLGHVARGQRASRRPDMLASVALGADAPETEEAMAILVERNHGVYRPAVDRLYAARLIAVEIASRKGINDVFADLLHWVSPTEAAAIAVRVKRGIKHADEPGTYSKDVIYRRGSASLERYLAAHPGDLTVLRATKWGLGAVRRFGGLFVETGSGL